MKSEYKAPFLVVLCSFVLAVLACGGSKEDPKNRTLILGRWDIAQAFRNQKQTETLQGVYFEFKNSGKMITNLPVGPETEVDYELNRNVLLQKGPKVLEYQVETLSDSVLVLAIELRGLPFELHLRRHLDAPQDTLQGGFPDTLTH
ncbi:MAG: hypothetical protein KGS48_04915 [Bacteroidetes bacterium]|nr:hypothetical protein [Bacteroidota bacterium]